MSAKKTLRRRTIEREKDIYRAQAIASGKPANIAEKMVAGKMEKFYEEVCLLEQPFIKDQTISISQLIAAKVGKLGENIAVRRFARFKVGDATATVAFVSTKPDSAVRHRLRLPSSSRIIQGRCGAPFDLCSPGSSN